MLHKWLFLTGSLPQLKRVWNAYGIGAAVVQGAIDHTPATFVIDPQGRETRLFISEMSYSSVPQLAEVLGARHCRRPARPPARRPTRCRSRRSRCIGPRKHVALPRALGGGTVALGPGHGPQLLLFFDTWENEVSNLSADLAGLNRYAALDSVAPLVAVDEANVEPSAHALPDFLRSDPGAVVSGRDRPRRPSRRRLRRAGLAVAHARLGLGRDPLAVRRRGEGLAEHDAARQSRPRRAGARAGMTAPRPTRHVSAMRHPADRDEVEDAQPAGARVGAGADRVRGRGDPDAERQVVDATPAGVADALPQTVRERDGEEELERDRPERDPERRYEVAPGTTSVATETCAYRSRRARRRGSR